MMHTITITAIGERRSLLASEGQPLTQAFTGTRAECLHWIAERHSEMAGRKRKPAASIEAAVAAWSRAGWADEWEMTATR